MTQLYLDTEFNGHGGKLISMALVSPGGYRWYCVRSMEDEIIHPWVQENVIPKLNWDAAPFGDARFSKSLHDFLGQFDNPEIICDWNADAALFCQWLSGPTYETSLDYPCRITILKTPPGQPVSKNPHNALADAEALMLWHQAPLKESTP